MLSRRVGRWVLATALGALLPLLAACTGSGSSADPTAQPTGSGSPSATSTDTVSLTPQGTTLALGDTATVEYAPDDRRSTVLELTVKKVRKGSKQDFVLFDLDARARAAAYYYVTVTVANAGDGVVGRDAVPVWGVDPKDVLLPPVSFGSPFKPCPSKPLPAKFGPGDSKTLCVVYQVADGGDLKALSYRPDETFNPIVWSPVVLSK
jgi:hypothetical protein